MPEASPTAPGSVTEASGAGHSAGFPSNLKHCIQYDSATLLSLGKECRCGDTIAVGGEGGISKCARCNWEPTGRDLYHLAVVVNDGVGYAKANEGGKFKALLLNTRSLHKHKLQVFDLLQDILPDLMFLTETWLTQFSNPTMDTAIPPGYKIPRKDCPLGKGGVYPSSLRRKTPVTLFP